MSEEDNIIELPIQEFGNAVTMTTNVSEELIEEVKAIVQLEADEFKKTMDRIKDVRWVKEPEIMLGPVVDKLQRFRPVGWHAYLASADYYVLSDYFKQVHACHWEHVPEKIDFKYVLSTIRRWVESRKAENYDEWDD